MTTENQSATPKVETTAVAKVKPARGSIAERWEKPAAPKSNFHQGLYLAVPLRSGDKWRIYPYDGQGCIWHDRMGQTSIIGFGSDDKEALILQDPQKRPTNKFMYLQETSLDDTRALKATIQQLGFVQKR